MTDKQETPREWLVRFFEFEYCDECGKGEDDHIVIDFLGNPFAHCTSAPEASLIGS